MMISARSTPLRLRWRAVPPSAARSIVAPLAVANALEPPRSMAGVIAKENTLFGSRAPVRAATSLPLRCVQGWGLHELRDDSRGNGWVGVGAAGRRPGGRPRRRVRRAAGGGVRVPPDDRPRA